ncbi:DUF1858 domain-containing protein [Thermococcus barophilus]|uniref:DUF1858 domain-containing protein n=1 Tax=Thermococcus barophilus (strain DSM 11836 / MP) TaxID=391623 RepID=F0LLP4_THEBM|nr:DUF1858 domain-containing protein [Thermococcus barophilus]ADT83821.1 hypothetical protein TERMP_00844 [Thermococcus barophilus MP]
MEIKAVLDLRGLNPPEPAVRIVEALKDLKEGEGIEAIGDKPFKGILPKLEEASYRHELKKAGDAYILRIWNDGSAGEISGLDDVECAKEIEINENTNVGMLIERYPEALEVLIEYGFTPLKDETLRKTLAKTITLKEAKELGNLSDEKFGELLEKLKKLKE